MRSINRLIATAILTILIGGCAGQSPYTYQGAGIGGAIGAGTGALIDHNNRWRGAMIGTLAGGVLGGAATELGKRAAQNQERQQTGQYPAYGNNYPSNPNYNGDYNQ
jgi:hypothetical protein